MKPLENHLTKQLQHFENYFWHRIRWKAASLSFPIKPSFTLLDIGAGAGLMGRFLKNKFPKANYVFIEPIKDLDAHLDDAYGADHNWKEKENFHEADVVVLLDVLEHQERDDVFLKNIIDKMAEGSRLVVTVPAFSFFWSDWDQKLGHFRRYTRASLKKRFAGLPFDIDRTFYLFPEMVFPALWRKLTGGNKTDAAEFPVLAPWLNQMIFLGCSFFFLFRHILPFGTSLYLAGKRKA